MGHQSRLTRQLLTEVTQVTRVISKGKPGVSETPRCNRPAAAYLPSRPTVKGPGTRGPVSGLGWIGKTARLFLVCCWVLFNFMPPVAGVTSLFSYERLKPPLLFVLSDMYAKLPGSLGGEVELFHCRYPKYILKISVVSSCLASFTNKPLNLEAFAPRPKRTRNGPRFETRIRVLLPKANRLGFRSLCLGDA